MTPSTTRLRRYDPLQDHLPYETYYSGENIWERITQPSVLVTLVILLVTLGYHLAQNHATSRGRQLPTIAESLWDAAVAVTPASLLYAIDRWVNPPLFPIPMLQPQPTTHAAKSDVLRKILRTDQPGGIVASVSQAGRRTLTNLSGSKGNNGQPAGLGNWDNSCFQNSILQGLASLTHLPRYLGGLTPVERPPHGDQTTTAGSLRAFIAELNDASNNGKTLFTPGILKNMSTIQQQDAQEYFSKLLDQVDKDIEKGAKATCRLPGYETDPSKDDTAASQHSDDSGYQSLPTVSKAGSELVTIRNPLEGLSAQRVACTACGYSEGLSMIPFNCLTLNFEGGHPHYDLFELLDNLVRLESIEGVECVKCTLLQYRNGLRQMAKALPAAADRLQIIEEALEEEEFDDKTIKKLKIPDNKMVSSTKTKQVVIGRPPPSLAMHMNRSVFDPTTFRSYKDLAAVRFPMTLDLGPWCIGSADGVRIPGEVKDGAVPQITEPPVDQEQWVLDAKASMVAGDAHPSRISGPIYELRSVVTHYGRHENGHYVCYRRHPRRTTQASVSSKQEGEAEQPANLADEFYSINDNDTDSRLEQTSTTLDTEEPYGDDADPQWWRLSDETVTKVTEQDVLSQGGVFMLFYDCVDPNSILVTPGETAKAEVPIGTFLTNAGADIRKPSSRAGDLTVTLSNAPAEPAPDRSETGGHPANMFGILSAQ
ncbi:ubiquitin-specific protease ubp1 [Cytospora paraplurivora]|uniref:ubiquitinyl hydrolase 1 n=1 Tax=Cytospora paraplurivora TaxID=2898453 RepID=A0AAN9UK24_9PEZI